MYAINNPRAADVLPMAARVTDELTAAELQLVEHLRGVAKSCLRCPIPSRSSVLADRARQKSDDEPERKLRAPSATYETTTGRRRKPDHGQWTTTTHATETRASGRSIPLAASPMRHVRAIWTLQPEHIASILARYAPDVGRRQQNADRLSGVAAERYQTVKTRQRARVITVVVLDHGGPADVRLALALTPAEWRSSNARRMYYDLEAWLERMDVEALLAWHATWSAPLRSV